MLLKLDSTVVTKLNCIKSLMTMGQKYFESLTEVEPMTFNLRASWMLYHRITGLEISGKLGH